MHAWSFHDAQRSVAQGELALACRLSTAELDELVEYGMLVPLPATARGTLRFPGSCVGPLREAVRQRSDYRLDLFTTGLLFGYLHRIAQLEQQVRMLQAPLSQAQVLPREGPTPWREPHAGSSTELTPPVDPVRSPAPATARR